MEEYLHWKGYPLLFFGGFLSSLLRFGCFLLLCALKITLKIKLFAGIVMCNYIFPFLLIVLCLTCIIVVGLAVSFG